MRALTLSRTTDYGSYWGAGCALICSIGLRRHTDVSKENLAIEVVAVKDDPNLDADLFDVRDTGTIVGVANIDCDLQRWLREGYALGYHYVYVNELD